jgi:hypothetical protein
MKLKIPVLWGMLVLAGCASSSWMPTHVDPALKARQEKELRSAQAALDAQRAEEAEKAFMAFQTKYPVSVFYQAAQVGEAKALELQGKWSEAAELYRQTIDATRETQPEIAAQALYEISFCYENLGDEARLIASLQDALRRKESLRPEWALAEIPARLAASYNRVGHLEEAQKYFHQAEEGMAQLQVMHNKEATSEWIARIYYEMGLYSTHQLAFENLQASIDTLKMVQIFSLRSVEANGEPWSQLAGEGLQVNYRDIWNTIQDIPLNHALDTAAAEREKRERQSDFVGQLLGLINDLRRHQTPEATRNEALKDLMKLMKSVEAQGAQFLASNHWHVQLTPESQQRNALKKEGVVLKPARSTTPRKAEQPEELPNPEQQKKIDIDPNL